MLLLFSGFFSCLFLISVFAHSEYVRKKLIVLEFFLLEQQNFSKIYMIIKRKLYTSLYLFI